MDGWSGGTVNDETIKRKDIIEENSTPINLINLSISLLIIYIKKFLHFDWLRAVQFFSKTVQKRVHSVQKDETNQAFL